MVERQRDICMTKALDATIINKDMKSSGNAKRSSHRVLLVDDESDILEVCKIALLANNNNHHHEVDAFSNPGGTSTI